MTVAEVADYLRVHRTTIYRMIASGELRPFKVGRVWRFHSDEIFKLAAKKS
jgi:excisionase family DNA binding protein